MHQNHSFSQNQVKSNHTYSWIKSSSRARFNHSNTSLEIHTLAKNIVPLTDTTEATKSVYNQTYSKSQDNTKKSPNAHSCLPTNTNN